MKQHILLFGTGSTIIVDVEESIARAAMTIAAGIRNINGKTYSSAPELTPDSIPADLKALPFLVPLFTPRHRYAASLEAEEIGLDNPFTLIDPTAILPHKIDLGAGSYVNAGCILSSCSRFGKFTFINRGASIGHHASIDDFVSIGPGCVLAGHVRIEDKVMIATGSTILPGLTIGRNSVVGAGSVVTKNVPPDTLVFGNPARVQRSLQDKS